MHANETKCGGTPVLDTRARGPITKCYVWSTGSCQKILWSHTVLSVVDVVPPFPDEIELSNYLRAPDKAVQLHHTVGRARC